MPKEPKTPPKTKASKPRSRSDGSAKAGKGQGLEPKGLTPRHSLFVLEYLKDQNASAAYKRAGYKGQGRAAENAASRMLGFVGVRAAIDDGLAKLRQKVEEETGISLKRVIEEIAKGAFFDPRKMFNEDGSPKQITDLPDAEASALAGFEVLEQFEGAGQILRNPKVKDAIEEGLVELRQNVQEETDVFKANLMRVSVQKCSGSRRA